MVKPLRLVVVSLLAVLILFLGNAHTLANDVPVTAVGGHAMSRRAEVVKVATIAPPGQVFSGTLISRSSKNAWDTVLAVYTDKRGKLWVNVEASDADNAQANRESDVSFSIVAGSVLLGKVAFDPDTGDFSITAGITQGKGWFQGTVMGMYAGF